MKYHITTIMPAGYIHSHCFDEVAELLVYSLEDLGHDATRSYNTFDADATNIILGYHLLHKVDVQLPERYIIYQLEPFIESAAWSVWKNANMMKVLASAPAIWDYDPHNIEFLKKSGIKAELLPIWMHEKLDRISFKEAKTDFLFYGSSSPVRTKIINILTGKCTVKCLFGVYGKERDEAIGESDIVLNIRQYDNSLFEQARVAYLMNNDCVVYCDSVDYWMPEFYGYNQTIVNGVVFYCLEITDYEKAYSLDGLRELLELEKTNCR